MTKYRIAASAAYCRFEPKTKRKIKFSGRYQFGSASSKVLVVLFILLAGAAYMYFINSTAVKGYEIRQVEKEIESLKKESEGLKIREAELNSLYYIEESSKKVNMLDHHNVSYLEETGPMALAR